VLWWLADDPTLADDIKDRLDHEPDVYVSAATTAGRLPMTHRDPFDRMLVAQAQCEDLTLVTWDENCRRYTVAILPA